MSRRRTNRIIRSGNRRFFLQRLVFESLRLDFPRARRLQSSLPPRSPNSSMGKSLTVDRTSTPSASAPTPACRSRRVTRVRFQSQTFHTQLGSLLKIILLSGRREKNRHVPPSAAHPVLRYAEKKVREVAQDINRSLGKENFSLQN